ncbi:MAG TPA: hypothetical protein VIU41_03775 [Geobacteraceae bacterium]
MKLNNKIKEMAVFIEFLAGSGLAIFFHLVLHHEQAAYIIFGVGVLLSLVTWLIREDVEKTREELLSQYRQSHELTFALAQIVDAECQCKAQEMLASVKRTIAMLQQGFIPMDETEFYLEGAKCSEQTVRTIKAVDPLTPGWSSRGALLNFYQANLRAKERGVLITRIFVVERDTLGDPDLQRLVTSQLRDGIDVRIAFRDELPTASDISGRDTNSSSDFALYDDQVATEVFLQPGKFHGRKTTQPAEVARYQRLFDLIEHGSHGVTAEDGQLTLAGDCLKLAS